jgi:hypothetical protein
VDLVTESEYESVMDYLEQLLQRPYLGTPGARSAESEYDGALDDFEQLLQRSSLDIPGR